MISNESIELLKAQQDDFLVRFELGIENLIYLDDKFSQRVHRELIKINKDELHLIDEYCWAMVDKYKNQRSSRESQNIFSSHLKGKLGEVAVKKYLENRISSVDLSRKVYGDQGVDFRLSCDSSICFQVKARHGKAENLSWSISDEELTKNKASIFVYIQEDVDKDNVIRDVVRYSEYNLILIGFVPHDLIGKEGIGHTRSGNKNQFEATNLLYIGGLNYYIDLLEKTTPLGRFSFETKKQKWDFTNLDSYGGSKINSITFSPDGFFLATGGEDHKLKIWDLKNRSLIHKIENNKGSRSADIYCISFHPNNNYIATCGWESYKTENSVLIWDLNTGNLSFNLTGHISGIYSICFTPNGKQLLSIGQDKTIRVWDLETRKTIYILKDEEINSPSSIVVDGCGENAIYSTGKSIKMFGLGKTEEKTTLVQDIGQIGPICISQNNDFFILVSGRKVKVYRLVGKKAQFERELEHSVEQKILVHSVAIGRGDKLLATTGSDETIKLWNLQTGKLLHCLEGHLSPISSVAISSSEFLVASGSDYQAEVKIWMPKQ
jgi:WD40 repeat protein